jgi:hypothetical protein
VLFMGCAVVLPKILTLLWEYDVKYAVLACDRE